MTTDMIAGLLGRIPAAELHSLTGRKGPRHPKADTLFKLPGPAADPLQLSKNAKAAYLEEDPSHKKMPDFEDRFKDALVRFTEYALHLNGFTGVPKGNHFLLALNVLGVKSGVRVPDNVVENKEEILDAFKSAWGLSDNATADEIYSTMVRVFGEDRSFSPNPSGPGQAPGLEPPVDTPDGPADFRPPVDTPDRRGDFRPALEAFTTQLFEEKGIPREPGDKDLHRVLNVLAEKLDLDPANGSLVGQITRALGAHAGTTMDELLLAMTRAFNL